MDIPMPILDDESRRGVDRMSRGDACSVLRHDREVLRQTLRLPIPVISFIFFTVMLFVHFPSSALNETSNALSSSFSSPTQPFDFYEVSSITDIFTWMNNTLIPSVFISETYNGDELPSSDWGMVASFNKVLGAVDLRSWSIGATMDCESPEYLRSVYPSCYNRNDMRVAQAHISFDSKLEDAQKAVEKIQKDGSWLQKATQELEIVVVTYNGELKSFAVTEFEVTFDRGGGISPSMTVTPIPADPYDHTAVFLLDAIVIILCLVTFSTPLRNLCKCKRFGQRHGWVVGDCIAILFVTIFYSVWASVVLTLYASNTLQSDLLHLSQVGKAFEVDSDEELSLVSVTNTLHSVAKRMVLLRVIGMATVVAFGITVLHRFSFHPKLNLIARTLSKTFERLGAFVITFVVIFLVFTTSGCLLFGHRVREFASLGRTVETCVGMLLGDFDYAILQNVYPPLGTLYYWSFMVIVSLLLLNMMLAIVLDAYTDVINEVYSRVIPSFSSRRVLQNALRCLRMKISDWRKHTSKRKLDTLVGHQPLDSTVTSIAHAHNVSRGHLTCDGIVRPDVLEAALMSFPSNEETDFVDSFELTRIFGASMVSQDEADATMKYLLDGWMNLYPPSSIVDQELDGERGFQDKQMRKSRPLYSMVDSCLLRSASPLTSFKERLSQIPRSPPQQTQGSHQYQEIIGRVQKMEGKLDDVMENIRTLTLLRYQPLGQNLVDRSASQSSSSSIEF